MKILMASGNGIYDRNYADTNYGQTGFKIMIRALADMLPMEGDEVDVITHSNFTRGHKIGSSNLLKRTWFDVFIHVKPFYLKKALYFCKNEKNPLKMQLRTLLYFMTGSYCEYLLKKNKYDVVHINGVGSSATAYMYACIRTNTPFVVTLHGLNSFGENIKIGKYGKNMEREFFIINRDNPKALSTVISTGIKNRLCSVVGKTLDSIHVVCNPVINANIINENPYFKESDERVIVTVGNVSKNKNQKLVVDAFAEMCKKGNGKYRLFVIGGQEADLKQYAESLGINNVTFTGSLERADVYSYYKIADLCVMASFEEGFGLSLVEGYSFGVPCVMPSTIDAFPDLYDEKCCVPAGNYEISTFADAMFKALNKNWDKKEIKGFSEKFSETNCAAGYLRVLRHSKDFGTAPMSLEMLDRLVDACLKKE